MDRLLFECAFTGQQPSIVIKKRLQLHRHWL